MRSVLRLVGLLAALLAVGCVTDQGTLAAAAMQPLDVDLADATITDLHGREVVGRDTRIGSVLGVPLLDGPRLDRAVEDALGRGSADVLLGARVRSIDYWFLVGWSTLEVRGRAVALGAREPR
jgi:hypothetical protein